MFFDNIINESYKENTSINFNGKYFNVKIKIFANTTLMGDEINNRIDNLIKNKPWNNKSLYKEIYNTYQYLWDDINNDPYFNGKKINNYNDLINSLQPTALVIYDEFSCIAGECWFDDEHGFSITFPNDKVGKFKKQTYTDNDKNYSCFGQYSSFL